MIKLRFLLPFFIFIFISNCLIGQTKEQLEAERKRLNAKIEKVNRLIFETKTAQKNALESLEDLNQKIEVREELIKNITLQINLLSNEIDANEREIATLNKKLIALKADYSAMILKSYKSKSQQSRAMFLLSSDDFRQAYKRLEYMKQYTSFRKKQGEEISIQANLITNFVDSLNIQKKAKDTLILSEEEQKSQIELDKITQEGFVSKIKKKEKSYKRQLQKSIKEEKKVAQKIDKLIREAIAKANKKVKVKPKSFKEGEFILSPEAKVLAAEFVSNKEKLPWPLKESLITRRFGIQKHPTIGGITLNSPGLHLVTKKGSYAESVFNGTVLTIQLTAGRKKNVLVQHGNYITAYNNLENSLVKKGDKVITGQKLGKVFTDKVTRKTTLIFVLFKNTTRLNPTSWLLRR